LLFGQSPQSPPRALRPATALVAAYAHAGPASSPCAQRPQRALELGALPEAYCSRRIVSEFGGKGYRNAAPLSVRLVELCCGVIRVTLLAAFTSPRFPVPSCEKSR
jgi:hypothetical protein